MEPKIQPTETSPFKADKPGYLSKPSSTEQIMSEWVEPIWQSIRSVLANVPDYIGEFFKDNKKPLVTLGLILAGFVTVKVTLAVLEAIGDIPLLAPLLQLIGIAYTAWFVYRYLWKASSRQELVAEIDAIKTQIFGHDTLSS
ncbi:MAG: hypothetical protein RLZZ148_1816 [Cyanobacteriota bacterium]|jgi:heme A synthase